MSPRSASSRPRRSATRSMHPARRSSPPRAAWCSPRRTGSCSSVRTSRSCGCGRHPSSSWRAPATGDHRPLLEHDPAGVLAKMAVDRDPLYREVADVVVDVEGLSPDEVTDRGARGGRRVITVRVPLGTRALRRARRSRGAARARGGAARRSAQGRGRDAGTDRRRRRSRRRAQGLHDRHGEDAKSLATVEELCSEFTQWGLNRADCVVAVGGGLVTDVGGFAAAVYHRGLPVVHVADHAARDGRRRDRRQDRRQPPRGQEPRRRVLAAGGGACATPSCSRRCRRGSGAADAARWRSTTSSPVTT